MTWSGRSARRCRHRQVAGVPDRTNLDAEVSGLRDRSLPPSGSAATRRPGSEDVRTGERAPARERRLAAPPSHGAGTGVATVAGLSPRSPGVRTPGRASGSAADARSAAPSGSRRVLRAFCRPVPITALCSAWISAGYLVVVWRTRTSTSASFSASCTWSGPPGPGHRGASSPCVPWRVCTETHAMAPRHPRGTPPGPGRTRTQWDATRTDALARPGETGRRN